MLQSIGHVFLRELTYFSLREDECVIFPESAYRRREFEERRRGSLASAIYIHR